MEQNSFELQVLVHGRPVREYYHDGEFWVEGRWGSEYKLKVYNPTHRRVCAIVTVDGVNVIDGSSGSKDGKGWIIDANDSIVIPGWQIDNASAAKFEFGSKSSSYSNQSGKGERNCGIIGCVIFEEKREVHKFSTSPPYIPDPYPWKSDPWRPQPRPWEPMWYDSTYTYSAGSTGGTPDMMVLGDSNVTMMGGGTQVRGFYSPLHTSVVGQSDKISWSKGNNASYGSAMQSKGVTTQSLGTSFGQKTGNRVIDTEFKRRSYASATLTVRYDTRSNLEKRGVLFDTFYKVSSEPNPFPQDGGYCKPPNNWRGY